MISILGEEKSQSIQWTPSVHILYILACFLHVLYILHVFYMWQQTHGERHPGRQKNQESVDSTRVRDTVIPRALEAFSDDRAHR